MDLLGRASLRDSVAPQVFRVNGSAPASFPAPATWNSPEPGALVASHLPPVLCLTQPRLPPLHPISSLLSNHLFVSPRTRLLLFYSTSLLSSLLLLPWSLHPIPHESIIVLKDQSWDTSPSTPSSPPMWLVPGPSYSTALEPESGPGSPPSSISCPVSTLVAFVAGHLLPLGAWLPLLAPALEPLSSTVIHGRPDEPWHLQVTAKDRLRAQSSVISQRVHSTSR